MYYKITNKESQVYKDLYEMRLYELQINGENFQKVKEKVELEFTRFMGYPGQQNVDRTTIYMGFEFTDVEKVDLKIWRRDKDNNTFFVPNRKTKAGREMDDFLKYGLKSSDVFDVFEILKLKLLRKLMFPFIEIKGDVLVLFLGDKHRPEDENLIEITSKEFEGIMSETK